jgi:hypothetical protein
METRGIDGRRHGGTKTLIPMKNLERKMKGFSDSYSAFKTGLKLRNLNFSFRAESARLKGRGNLLTESRQHGFTF